ncbi:shikimate dehydrogenase [Gallaecimonas kandeliae]|uniref:shikimate dehydrogenase n=1 Tax=Gallaecimonas kandeliae TaxID=3029055 RepID=UPI00264A1A91|nr:shikimate dehydrogenase [Gallaecimonas kandeliae]WKE65705.1 shikimate dehydrogenase [Gallaecimonas kandeliae]
MDLYTVIGNPVEHSRSPWMQARFAELAGQHIKYDRTLAPLDGFGQTLTALAAAGLKGANVTVPFKEEAFALADGLTARARQAGAVNTLIRRADGTWLGDNTDGVGLVADLLRLGADPKGKRVLVLGAGGASRGILGPLLERQPARLILANRTFDKARRLAEQFPIQASSYAGLAGQHFDLVINATSSSLHDEVPAVPADAMMGASLAYDLVYRKGGTAFEHWARAQGAKASADGLGMLVAQGAESFYQWRGVRPDWQQVLAEMKESL